MSPVVANGVLDQDCTSRSPVWTTEHDGNHHHFGQRQLGNYGLDSLTVIKGDAAQHDVFLAFNSTRYFQFCHLTSLPLILPIDTSSGGVMLIRFKPSSPSRSRPVLQRPVMTSRSGCSCPSNSRQHWRVAINSGVSHFFYPRRCAANLLENECNHLPAV